MATVYKNSVRNNQVINDFGQKIGGAHKDRAREAAAALYGVDASALMLKPLSKVAKLPDLRALYLAGSIDEATARRAWFLWSQIGTKPGGAYPSRLKRWADNAAAIIEAVADVLTYGEPEKSQLPEGVRVVQSWELFSEEMNAANWPADDYKRGAYFVGGSWYESGYSIHTEKKSYYKKYNTVADCVAAIREMVGDNSTKGAQQFSMYKTRAGVYYITPKGKQGIKLVEFNNEADAWAAYRDSQKLEEIYNELRKFPSERRDWNRPRVGNDYRQGRDMSPEAFAEVFPFRGVEFGNWVNQIERAACLNEAADALQDLAAIIGIRPEAVALGGSLAWAFGSRGVGRALAHYETGRRVVNLTKKKGNGCIAHEWFHALDHFVMIQQGRPSFMAVSDSVAYGEAEKSPIRRAAYDLKKALNASEMCKRAARIDAFKAKAYWSTVTELAARGFEAVIYYKLQAAGLCNDYLVNFKECNEWSRPDCYPYPTKEEAAELAPLYDAFIAAAFSEAERAPIAEGVAYGEAEKSQISARLEEIRAAILAENVSYEETIYLQEHAKYIDPSDTILLEWAGVLEHQEDDEAPAVAASEPTNEEPAAPSNGAHGSAYGEPEKSQNQGKAPLNIPTVAEVIRLKFEAGTITIKEAAREFCRCGWTNYTDEAAALRFMYRETSPEFLAFHSKTKEKHPEAVLLYRCGDFYECHFDDAKTLADCIGVTIRKENGAPVAGFPFHALDTYLPKLIRSGHRVVICDDPRQVQKPSEAPAMAASEPINEEPAAPSNGAQGSAYGDAEKSQISEIRPEVEALRARARNAGRLTSFDPEKLGDSFISELENALRAFESQLPEEIRAEKVAAYISKWSEWLAARSRCISSAITGPARFPVARAEKLNEYERNAWNRLQEWADKVVKRCNAEKRLTGWEEVERLTAKAEKLEHLQELMKSANKIVRQRVSDIEKLDALVALGFSEKWANEIMTPDCMGHIGFASFELSNNLAKIKDARAKIARHEALAGKEDHTEAYEWGELEFCYSEERYRLHFPGKPSAEILNFLKSHGWKWSRANCAWQRQITNGAAYNLRQFIEKFGGKVKPSAEVHASEPMNEEPAEEPNAPSNGAQGSAYGDAEKSQNSMNPGEVYKTAKADRYIIILSDDGEKLRTTDAIRGRFSGNIDTSDKDRFLSCLDAGSIIKSDASQLPPVTDVHTWREGLEHGYGKAFEIRTELIYTASDSMTEAEKADTAARMGFSLPLDPLAVLQVSALHKWNASRGNYRHCAALEWLVSQQDEPTAFKMNAGAYPVIFADYARRI